MRRVLSLLILCCALRGLDALEANGSADSLSEKMLLEAKEKLGTFSPAEDASTAAQVVDGPPGEAQPAAPGRDAPAVRAVQETTAAPLEDEEDNQENIISQLLGDYDKVKTISSGSDCVCRCVVRPIKRSDCSRIHDSDPASVSREFYTVETITKGTDCKKCVCMAPPTAVNPCEGEYRFKKLQEASKDDIKLATIIDLLEGSMYGMDLLKLQSVTTKLLTRMDNMEKAFTRNLTERAREKERAKDKAKDKDKDKKAQQKKKKTNDPDCGGAKNGAGVSTQKQKTNENQLKKNQQQDGLVQHQPKKNTTAAQSPIKEKTEPKQPMKDKNMVIRGVTFYKAEEEKFKEDEKARGKDTAVATKPSVDLLISDQVPPIQPPLTKRLLSGEPNSKKASKTSVNATASTVSSRENATATKPPPSTVKPTELPATTTPVPTTTKHAKLGAPTKAALQPKPRSRISWTESPADQPRTTKKPGMCKDTVASISEPVQQNSFGLSDGAWMRDARGHGNVIYLTNGHYGHILQEFRDLDAFKSGQPSNSYKLPYSFTGTGHVVFNGAFYYNRAFSRDVIRYDLRHRFVAAWTTLHDALLEEQAHRTQSEVELAVDESGLWLLYPALDSEGFHQEVILLVHLNHRDLQTIRSFRTGLRRGRYGNTFLVCGVLYGVDSMERRDANVTYAFDTHTFTHTMPSLAFTNAHRHTSQVSYCPLDKKLYAWDDGHQMTYDVIFAY
ncbi:unnamed protein product [Ophioblennius macclurei]